jgi:YidC/Oxa1 family membrane protein insertase
MPGWDSVVEVLRQLIFLLSHHMGGSVGGAIVVVSAVARVLLLPLTVRAALAAREHQARIARIQPQLDALAKRNAGKPVDLATHTAALHREHGIPTLPKGTLLTLLVQFPIGAALYQAVRSGLTAGARFLWIGDLARPDYALTAVVGILAALGVYITGATQPAATTPAGMSTYSAAIVSGLLTVFFAFRLASGVGIYWAASSLVGLVQPVIVRQIVLRREK